MHRLRKNGLKVQHTILGHLKPVLTKLLADCELVTRIIPGEISVTKGMGQGKNVGIRITVPLMTRRSIRSSHANKQDLCTYIRILMYLIQQLLDLFPPQSWRLH